MITIGLDASSILPRRTGIGWYTWYLLRELARLESAGERYRVFMNSLRHPFPEDARFLKSDSRFRMRRYRLPGPWLVNAWRKINAPSIDLLNGAVDVFHAPATYIPPQRHGARMATIHDLYFMRRLDHCHALGGQYLAESLPRRAHQLDRVIAVSHSTARDVIEYLHIPEDRIRVIHSGVDPRFARPVATTERETLRRRYDLPGEYILALGSLEPRKNLPGLLRAYRLLLDEWGADSAPPPLVLAGATGWGNEEMRRVLDELKLAPHVRFPGYIAEDDLPALYAAARLFAMPSLYEGFGLPVLEAMAAGTPVVTSNNSSLIEIAGEAAWTVDAEAPAAIAEALQSALTDETARATFIQAGRQRATRFSWAECARQTRAVYLEFAP